MKSAEKTPLFICGAGLSVEPPSALALTKDILDMACRSFLPSSTGAELRLVDLVRIMQPEVFFEQASLLLGNGVHDVWKVLDRETAKPNLNHYLLIALASHFRVPIITLNFDTLLEAAAEASGVKPCVYVPGRHDLLPLLTSKNTPLGSCAIWKIHGCLKIPGSMQSTMSQLAHPNEKLLRPITELVSRCAIHIVGYSGRDGDFFPELVKILMCDRGRAAQPQWIDPYWSSELREKAHMLDASVRAERFENVVTEDFPWGFGEVQRMAKDLDLNRLRELAKSVPPRDAGPHFFRIGVPSTEVEKEALLMCLLFQSGNIRQAYAYGADRIERFQRDLPPRSAAIVTLYFARLCDWNSQYLDFLDFSMRSEVLAKKITSSEERPARLFVESGSACLSTRALWMLQGPTMTWPDRHLSFSWDRKQRRFMLYRCLRTSLAIRKSIAGFSRNFLGKLWRIVHPHAPAPAAESGRALEVMAWQYYLDHSQVFLNSLIKVLVVSSDWHPQGRFVAPIASLVRLLARSAARLALWRLTWLARRVGAAYTQADLYLFRSRYGIADDLTLAEHFWTLVGHPVGRALIVRDRAVRYMRAGDHERALRAFRSCYCVAVSSGSHLTALKALIGLFHLGVPLRRSRWERHVHQLQGDQYVSFFDRATNYLVSVGAFK
jgi:hypothetical protein